MKIVKKTHEMKILSAKIRAEGQSVGLVTTMGFLHLIAVIP